MKRISWDDYKVAYQVTLDGSLSQAGKTLEINHATVLRHVNRLEKALEVKLFIRHQRGYQLTDAGSVLMEELPGLIAQFSRLENKLHNVEGQIAGELRITTLSSFSSQLTPALKTFRDKFPKIRIKLLSTDDIVPLESGAAHISLRAGSKPNGPDLIVKNLTEFATQYYVAQSYIDKFGLPKSAKELNDHYWALPTSDKYRIPFIQHIVDKIDKDKIIFQSSHFPDVNQAVIEGMGIGPFTVFQANQITNLVKVPIDLPQYQESMWFVYHKDLKHSARIQCFYECLSEHLSTL
ncbi:LysR family transcriptional regulator [Pseudoalteromonas sp. NBT06-2]|uniref:LysR family transcriptional regulator n=1 Tax=Pseudoalteromonas sp. NBT06-2 TaxID=2025950 RepID=UPI000BA7A4B6|nr:LysR family transcriptional regulator [Pseudoalteromonas sp. NBT06-2]PAJ73731.1 LysR family transcriptional regulator [Pseudoalteromonas sp. NBT06-2]